VKHNIGFAAVIAILSTLAACGGDQTSATKQAPPQVPAAANAGPLTPAPGGKIIEVEMVSDGEGNYFKPNEVHANRGDVIRFTLKVGVHNVHFLADSNAGRSGYPSAPSDFLQLPGQTYDVGTQLEPGSYYFQCDPHAALGMKGHLILH
jgi:plastocyanin